MDDHNFWVDSKLVSYLITGVLGIMALLLFSHLRKKFFSFYRQHQIFQDLKILEIETEKQCQDACNCLKLHCKEFSVLGFDCEWDNTGSRPGPVALLQLATGRGFCCLFRLNIFGKVPAELQDILQDLDIIKVGVEPIRDSHRLKEDYQVQVNSTLDLRYLYNTPRGLGYLSKAILDVSLDKSSWVKCSNWEKAVLTSRQREYAAKDAYISVALFKKWLSNNRNNGLDVENSFDNEILTDEIKSQISMFLDKSFKVRHLTEPNKNSGDKAFQTKESLSERLKRGKPNFVTRKNPLYHNCFMHAPDGQLLCSCDKKKAKWYIDKNLAEVMSSGEPFAIRLLFEPTRRGSQSVDGKFYEQLKQNCCVVCGVTHSYLRHMVVPKEYRKHFPVAMKSHKSHDILLMCLECHYKANYYNSFLREKLAVMCGAPIINDVNEECKVAQRIKNSANALLHSGNSIPQERKIQLENTLKEYYKVEEVTKAFLMEAISKPTTKIKNGNDTNSHGFKTVQYFQKKDGGLLEFERLWRTHFVETMKPKHLPAFWSVTYNSIMSNSLQETAVNNVPCSSS